MSTKPLRWKHRLKRKRMRFPAWSSESHTQNSSGCGAARFACERHCFRRRIRARARPTCVAFGAFGSACSIRFTSRINYDIIIVRRKRIEQIRAAFGVEEEISAFLLSGYVLRPSGTEYRFLNLVEFHSARTGILLTFYPWSILTDSKLGGCSVTGSPVLAVSFRLSLFFCGGVFAVSPGTLWVLGVGSLRCRSLAPVWRERDKNARIPFYAEYYAFSLREPLALSRLTAMA